MKKKKKKVFIIVLIIIVWFIHSLVLFGIICFLGFLARVEVYDDVSKYNDYIGLKAKDIFKIKWGMDESIFPESITSEMNIKDFKMVYYNPWDAQYLAYLVVDYKDDEYKQELNRLNNYESTEYRGYYGVKGFTKYKLLAMNADSYHGFVYAITDDENTIIYVEIIFCNYFMDLKYKKYINEDYLPDGFDATIDNKYQKANT